MRRPAVSPDRAPLATTQRVEYERRICDAAIEVAVTQGCQKASVADVVKMAGVARNTFYDHFAGLAEVFEVAIERTIEEAGWVAREGTAGEQLERIDEWTKENPNILPFLLVEAPTIDPYLYENMVDGILVAAEAVTIRDELAVLAALSLLSQRVLAGATSIEPVLPDLLAVFEAQSA